MKNCDDDTHKQPDNNCINSFKGTDTIKTKEHTAKLQPAQRRISINGRTCIDTSTHHHYNTTTVIISAHQRQISNAVDGSTLQYKSNTTVDRHVCKHKHGYHIFRRMHNNFSSAATNNRKCNAMTAHLIHYDAKMLLTQYHHSSNKEPR